MTDIREWSHADKSDWGPGEWQQEPDKVHWVDEATNLDCLLHRNRMGAWCGYVGVAEGHPAFQRGYDDVDVDVHGGLTFADFCDDDASESFGICHVPFPGRPDRVWWLGFDCAHAFDLLPANEATLRIGGFYDEHPEYTDLPGDTYRNRAYAEAEVRSLAGQLATYLATPPQVDSSQEP